MVGILEAAGRGWPQPVPLGAVVATGPVAASLPCWLSELPEWDGRRRTLACAGHAILHAGTPTLGFSEAVEAEAAAVLARAAWVPGLVGDVTHPGDRVAVLGAGTVAGALGAVVASRRAAESVAGLVGNLQEARLGRALGVAESVIADPVDPSGTAAALATALGGSADVVLVALDDPRAVVTATLLAGDGTVLLGSSARHAELATATAAAVGLSTTIRADRPVAPDSGAALLSLVGSLPTLRELIRWRAGTGPAPEATRPEQA